MSLQGDVMVRLAVFGNIAMTQTENLFAETKTGRADRAVLLEHTLTQLILAPE